MDTDPYAKSFYEYGLAKADRADMLDGVTEWLLSTIGKHFSHRCMDKFGYAKQNLSHYIVGALRGQNTQSLEFLKKIDLEYCNFFFNKYVYTRTNADIVLFGLRNGLTLTEANIKLYKDVIEEQV